MDPVTARFCDTVGILQLAPQGLNGICLNPQLLVSVSVFSTSPHLLCSPIGSYSCLINTAFVSLMQPLFACVREALCASV